MIINIKTKEVLEISSLINLKHFFNSQTRRIDDCVRYWKKESDKKCSKTYKGYICIDKQIFESLGIEEVIKKATTQKEFDRSKAAVQSHLTRGHVVEKKAPIPYEERNLQRKAVILVNKEDDKEYEFRSIREAVIAFKLVYSKVYKVMHNEYKKYSHNNFYIRYK